MNTIERINNLAEPERRQIKGISSDYVRADAASREGNDAGELEHLLRAVYDISVLLLLKSDGLIDDCTACEYAASMESSAHRINEILCGGVQTSETFRSMAAVRARFFPNDVDKEHHPEGVIIIMPRPSV